jgi:ectoine hydroxylase-related dioxygenase (phytanoyl-CoA dioxygenase family)
MVKYSILSASQVSSLTRTWQKAIHPEMNMPETWENDLKNIYHLEIGMQELLQFLYNQQPDLDRFLRWADERGHAAQPYQTVVTDVLTEADLKHWQEQGYVVLRQAVNEQEYTAANEAIWKFLGANRADPISWYRQHPAMSGLMVVFTEHEALKAIRNSARIRKAYEQLYGTTAINKVVDKVSFNPPQNEQYEFKGSPLHWDTSLVLPIPDKFQGLLYLTNVTSTGGAFQCVPGFHRSIGQWIAAAPAGIDLRQYAAETLKPVAVPGNAGDLIIWHEALPHCASANLDREPRLVQYLTYKPDHFDDQRPWI